MMFGVRTRKRTASIAAMMLVALACAAARGAGPTFRVTLDPAVLSEPYTGRVHVLLSKRPGEPRQGPSWFGTEPFLSFDVTDLPPGEPVELTPGHPGVLTYPRSWDNIDISGYRLQAVARLNPHERNVGTGAGNGYGPVVALGSPAPTTVELRIDRLVAPIEFEETPWVKLLRVRSQLLSDFHGRDLFLQAAVTLPPSYHTSPDRRYPTIFTVPGFGGTHFMALSGGLSEPEPTTGVEFLRVTLDPSCPLGHHVFADSDNNGPVNRALREELIPALDREFRSVAKPEARFLTGHSSGGWSSLWIQVTAPEEFAGVWSTAPDPVDLSDFQRIDVYRSGENMYVDPQGRRRPLARVNDRTVLWYDDFAWMEHVNGYGGQLHSFEAVFSERGADGLPKLLWNRETGEIDPVVADTWRRYDIRLILEHNWPTLGPKLAGKLHVFMGTEDTFYLDGATAQLKESLARLGSDAVVELHAGKDHSTLLSPELVSRIEREMAESWLRSEAKVVNGQ
jgi:S-formylglutathione hydrolase FrmB